MVSFPKRYQYHQIGTPPSSGQSRHHQLPLVFPYPSSSLRGFSTSLTSHPDSFHSFILRAGSSSLKLLSYFRFGQTRGETKTLQIVLESFCIHSPAHASFYLSYGGCSCFPPFPSWNLPSFTVKSTLTSLCSRSDPSLTRQGAALAHLDSLPFMIWYSGLTALFLSCFGKGGSGVLANCFLCGTEATLSYSAGPVCSSFSVEACAILHGFLLVPATPTSLPLLFFSPTI